MPPVGPSAARNPACNLWVRANQEDDIFVIDKTGKKGSGRTVHGLENSAVIPQSLPGVGPDEPVKGIPLQPVALELPQLIN
jgi:hypothetical protein